MPIDLNYLIIAAVILVIGIIVVIELKKHRAVAQDILTATTNKAPRPAVIQPTLAATPEHVADAAIAVVKQAVANIVHDAVSPIHDRLTEIESKVGEVHVHLHDNQTGQGDGKVPIQADQTEKPAA